jgi:hypothetical protein
MQVLWHIETLTTMAAQQGAGADAALRPQDRRHFESWNRPDRLPDLVGRRGSAPALSTSFRSKGHLSGTLLQRHHTPIEADQICNSIVRLA